MVSAPWTAPEHCSIHKAVSPLTVQLWLTINTPHYQLSVCGSDLTDAIYEDRGNTLSMSLLHLWHYVRYVEMKWQITPPLFF